MNVLQGMVPPPPTYASISQKSVAILAAQDEGRTIASVVEQLKRLSLREIIAVVNGSRDDTARAARSAGCRVIEFPQAIGHDVGRAVGAAAALDAEAYLFVDADIVLRAEELMPFLGSVASGVDVALNDLRAWATPIDAVNEAKLFLNLALGRPELGTASLTAVPNALSRRAVETIGPHRLSVPPLAHAVAVLAGLNVRPVHSVNVVSTNRQHPQSTPARAPASVQNLIIGDHLEAIGYILQQKGPRGGRSDGLRQRQLVLPAQK
jgi:hypothetical protein